MYDHCSITIGACHTEEKFKSSSVKKVDRKIPSYTALTNHVSETLKKAKEHAHESFHVKINFW